VASPDAVQGANLDHRELAKFNAVAHSFWDPQGEMRPLHLLNPLRLAFIAARAELRGARVLDVGCGGGLLAEGLVQRGADVTAIDLSPGMIDTARLHAAEGRLNIDYRVAGAEALLADGPGRFDVVTCMEMLEHVPQPAHMVATLAGLVRPGGSIFVSTLNRSLRSWLLAVVAAEYVLKLIPRGTHEYERLIRPAELARWSRAAGLCLRELAGIQIDPFLGSCRISTDVGVNYLAHLTR
jgi:2-polyprenyl-6-hydroxyphenyl methylase / 3-demethylubiquinone-9 3-methyltransferase